MRLFDAPTRLCLVLGWRNSILALEALGEVGWAGEAYHVAYLTDSVVARVEEGGCKEQSWLHKRSGNIGMVRSTK